MKTAKDVALVSVYTALLMGAQLALAALSGVEIVTALLLAFCYNYGIVRGLFVSTAFSLLRCFIFGFFPTVLILYLVYYTLFVVVFGLLGRAFKRKTGVRELVITVLAAMAMTVFFTLLDDVITPLYYGYTLNAAKAYAIASLAAMVPQVICVAVTVSLLQPVLARVLK